jgi:outer membrane lipoprotein-sorting protein
LKFLLRERLDLRRDLKIIDTLNEPEGVQLILEDATTLGGTSRITLYFDHDLTSLKQWRILDPQGGRTTIVLSNVIQNARIDSKLFVINYERLLETR